MPHVTCNYITRDDSLSVKRRVNTNRSVCARPDVNMWCDVRQQRFTSELQAQAAPASAADHVESSTEDEVKN